LIEPLGIYQLMLVGAGILMGQLWLTNCINSRKQKPQTSVAAEPAAPWGGSSRTNAFAMVLRTRYLLLIALMMMVLNLVNTMGEYILGSMVKDAADAWVSSGQADGLTEGEVIGEFYSKFFTLVNVFAILLQLFVASRAVKHLGVPVAVMICR
jgi:AAA family ATP:ADP antiporter